ncbi:hypothetical protein VINE108274_17145 [Vibrio neptunius]
MSHVEMQEVMDMDYNLNTNFDHHIRMQLLFTSGRQTTCRSAEYKTKV